MSTCSRHSLKRLQGLWTFLFTVGHFLFTTGQFLFLYRTISRTITVIAIVISSGQYIISNHMTRRAECGVYLVVGQIRSARPLKLFTTVHIPSFNLFSRLSPRRRLRGYPLPFLFLALDAPSIYFAVYTQIQLPHTCRPSIRLSSLLPTPPLLH